MALAVLSQGKGLGLRETTTKRNSKTITLKVNYPPSPALVIKMAISTIAVALTVTLATCNNLRNNRKERNRGMPATKMIRFKAMEVVLRTPILRSSFNQKGSCS